MIKDIFIFDRARIRQKRNRGAKHPDHHFLFDVSINHIEERLSDIKRDFQNVLRIGCRGRELKINAEQVITLDIAEKLSPDVHGDEELLPFKENSFDLIISPLSLHSTNDLPGVLAQIQRILKPDGLFIGGLLGGETLHELRQVMNKVALARKGGMTPHIHPMVDMPQMGDLIQRTGFALPVIDSEKVIVTYDHPLKLMQDLRLMGESNSLIDGQKAMIGKDHMADICTQYIDTFSTSDGKIEASFEMIYVIGWAPHETQQKPLKPGSAQNRLADALQSKEKALPC